MTQHCKYSHQFKQNKNTKKIIKRRKKEKKVDKVNILYTNANGLRGKIDSLHSAATATETDIITVVETKLDSAPPNLEKYSWVTRNRTVGKGGGVGIAIHNNILKQVSVIENIESDEDTEIIWVAVKNHSSKKCKNLAIGVFYGPQENENKEKVEKIYSVVSSQINSIKQNHEIILTGDFNAKLQVNTLEINQNESRNGTILKQMNNLTGTIPYTIKNMRPEWTRINRKNPNEKAILDYVITSEQTNQLIYETKIDTEGIYRLKHKTKEKGIIETDHETILIKTTLPKEETKNKQKTWNLKKQEGWINFNEIIQKQSEKTEIKTYENWEKTIKTALNKVFGKKTTGNITKQKESMELKEARQKKKKARKDFENAIRNKHEINKNLDIYKETQKHVRDIIEKERSEDIKNKYDKIIQEGGIKSQYFWKARRKILGSNKPLEYDVITEEGTKITDPTESKKYIAEYYQNLYQAREATLDELSNTKEIENVVNRIAESNEARGPQKPIAKEEIDAAIKRLKKGKSMGPDNIPNEAIIELNQKNRNTLKEVLNRTLQDQDIPKSWETGTITRLYKGKGTRGKCSNERGITVSSNSGKLFERIVNNRAKQITNISDAQAKEKRATTDHLMILKEIINGQKERKKPIYLAFLDVTKAYDKAWLTGIMYVLQKNGVTGPLWNTIRKLNTNLKATIKTKDGQTETIKIKDSIRQGGVLSVILYALLMDEIAKEITKLNKGCYIPGTQQKIGCLLWVDDVVLMSESEKELQEMLDITHKIAKRYHIEFGKEKSMIMTTVKTTTTKFTLGNLTLDRTKTYKYLGETLHERHKLDEHIKQTKRKVEGAFQTILGIAGDPNLKGIEMETIWKLIETCIIPILTYGCETWDPTQKELKELNKILEHIIKRTLMIPTSTPRESIYIETGMKDIKFYIDKNRLNMEKRIEKTKNKMIENILKSNAKKSWRQTTENTHIENETNPEMNKEGILKKLNAQFKLRTIKNSREKSKVKFLIDGIDEWKPGERQTYLSKLKRKEASLIFKTRNRMLKIKRNYKNAHTNLTCRGCNAKEETQQHVMEECTGIHTENNTKVLRHEYFTNDIDMLRKSIIKIETILARLEQSVAPPE